MRRVLIRLGHSPDPDDAFMFWALAAGEIDTRGFEFEHVLRDIQTLNEWALDGPARDDGDLAARVPVRPGSLRGAAARREHGLGLRARSSSLAMQLDARAAAVASRSRCPGG